MANRLSQNVGAKKQGSFYMKFKSDLFRNFFRRKKLLGALFFLTVLICNFSHAANSSDDFSSKDIRKLIAITNDIKKYYYKPVDNKTLLNYAISGMLSNLDPHSAYLEEDDLKDLEMATVGKFGGIGIEVTPYQGFLKIISPLDGTPAEKAGLKAGDIIMQINSKLVKDMQLKDAINMMRGPKGSKISLTIVRKNTTHPINVTLTREIIKVKTIKDHLYSGNYGYVRIAFFQESTEKDLLKTINAFKKETAGNIKGLIIDLRNNPGGTLESAVRVADCFLDANKTPKNKLLVYTKGNAEDIQVMANASPGEILPGTPIVVLINEGSASASEIVAGALQDHKRAIIVGQRSFGKGSVQTVLPIDEESAIKLTTALYYTPSGKSIQAKGIEPDISIPEMKLSKKSLANEFPRIDESALVDHLENGDGDSDENIARENGASDSLSNEEINLAYKDYQLYEALHILKGLTTATQN
jgi:carboxyl-terminal processing protease